MEDQKKEYHAHECTNSGRFILLGPKGKASAYGENPGDDEIWSRATPSSRSHLKCSTELGEWETNQADESHDHRTGEVAGAFRTDSRTEGFQSIFGDVKLRLDSSTGEIDVTHSLLRSCKFPASEPTEKWDP